MIPTFNKQNFHKICDGVAAKDAELKFVIEKYGYPPLWSRENSFESLVHIILEQQVSLASALAALNKLKETVKEVTPANVLQLTDAELKACYFSRQKTAYVRYLAEALINGQIDLAQFPHFTNDEVRQQLTALKGIGNWTVDVYLMFILHRTDVFPAGDLAAVLAFKKLKQLPKETSKDELVTLAAKWAPYRTIATMILWHFYLSTRNNKLSLPL